MKISTKGRYALRIMVELAQHDQNEYLSLKVISERQEISMKYLEMIVAILNKAGFVISLRGKDGGYKLAKPANEYIVGSVLKITEGSLSPVSCLDYEINPCRRADRCVTLPLWEKLDRLIDDYLENVTIEDLIVQQKEFAGCGHNI